MNKPATRIFPLLLALFAFSGLIAQPVFKSTATQVSVSGTSTLHDWTMTSNTANISAVFEFDDAGKPTDLLQLTFGMAPTLLKSGHGAMDDNAYKALNAKQFNVIKYATVNCKVIPGTGNKFTVSCSGILTIAGKSANTDLTANCVLNADGTMVCTGSKSLKMSTYGVKAPSFMMGTIKTGDEITIHFKTTLSK